MKIRDALIGWAVFVALLAGAYWSGGNAREEGITARLADTVEKESRRVRDSIGNAAIERDRDDSITGAAVIAAMIYEKNVATKAANIALENADTVKARAIRTLADTLATVVQLRVALVEAVFTLDTLAKRLLAERVARERERHVSDSIARVSRRKILDDFDAYRNSVAQTDSAQRKDFTTNIALAEGNGKRRGRIEGAIVATLVILATVKAAQ